MKSQVLSRRDFLKVTGLGSAALVFGNRLNAMGLHFPNREQRKPFVPDAEISLTATDKRMQILPGAQTRV